MAYKHNIFYNNKYNSKNIINIFYNKSNIDINERKAFIYDIKSKNETTILNKFKNIIINIKFHIEFRNKLKEERCPTKINERINFNKKIRLFKGVINFFLFQIYIFINIILCANSNEITIKTIGNEKKNILNSDFTPQPNQIYVNERLYSINNENEIEELEDRENNIRMIWDNQIEDCTSMFKGLDNIIEVDLSNFDSSKVTSMSEMFYDCTNITSITFNNIDTSLVNSMDLMFMNCESLISLDLSGINTKSLNIMNYMFCNCKSLISLNLNNFNTSLVSSMQQLFAKCSSIKALDLSSFNTSKLGIMTQMFAECNELTSIDISHFDLSEAIIMTSTFYNCNY